jgi:hypothetical protein
VPTSIPRELLPNTNSVLKRKPKKMEFHPDGLKENTVSIVTEEVVLLVNKTTM